MTHASSLKPPAVLLAHLVAVAVVHVVAPVADLLRFPWNLAGLVPVVAGIALNVVADRMFASHGCASACCGPAELLTRGPYALSRNPMYLGLELILLGIALVLGTLSPLLTAALFVPLINRRFIRCEETHLEIAHGRAWSAYSARVRRWL